MVQWSARLGVIGLAGGLLAVAGPAGAAEVRIFRLPAEPVSAALVRFAIQGDVSVGGPGCVGRSRAVLGPMRPATALRRLLPPSCSFETVDAHSFRITAAPARAAPAAAGGAGPSAMTVGELVVTAEKRPEPLTGSAFAITALPASEIERLGGRSFDEVAWQIAGVTVTNLGSGRNKIFIRGLSDGAFTGQTQSTVGLYLDDVPITYSAPDPDLRLVDIDRVEVLRGPQGSLYGSGSIGGIVRIISNVPDPSALAGSVTIEAATADNGAPSSGVAGTLNVPLPALRGAVRVSAYRDRRGGYIDNPQLGLTDVNASTRTGVRAAAAVALPASWALSAGFTHQGIDTRDSQYTDAGHALARRTAVREPHDNDFTELGASLAHSGATADLKLSAAWIDHGLDTRYDASGSLGTSGPAAFDEMRQVDLFVAEAVLASAGGGRLHWLGGLFASKADETGRARLVAPPAANVAVYRRRDELSEAAAYGEATYALTDRLAITAGGRLFSSYLASHIHDLDLASPPGEDLRRHVKAGGFAPKLRLSYAAAPNATLYAQVQEGYRSGGFNIPASAGGQVGAATAATAFRPDRLLSFEAGVVWPLAHDTLDLRAALFRAAWKHVQTDQYLASGLPVTVNIGDGANTGLEAEAVWRPDGHWRLGANFLLEDPEITHVSDAFPASADIGLPGVPRFQGSADVRYRWRIAERLRAELSGQYAYVGRSHLTFDGAAASAMGGYGVGRVSFALEDGAWRLSTYLDNIANARGDTFAFGNPFSRGREAQSTPLRPRTLGVALDRHF